MGLCASGCPSRRAEAAKHRSRPWLGPSTLYPRPTVSHSATPRVVQRYVSMTEGAESRTANPWIRSPRTTSCGARWRRSTNTGWARPTAAMCGGTSPRRRRCRRQSRPGSWPGTSRLAPWWTCARNSGRPCATRYGPFDVRLPAVGVVWGISERFLIPAREAPLPMFPFPVLGSHADNGSEYINHRVVGLLQKLHVGEFTKSRTAAFCKCVARSRAISSSSASLRLVSAACQRRWQKRGIRQGLPAALISELIGGLSSIGNERAAKFRAGGLHREGRRSVAALVCSCSLSPEQLLVGLDGGSGQMGDEQRQLEIHAPQHLHFVRSR